MREPIRHIIRGHTKEIGEAASKVSFGQFLKRARDVHGDKYDYDKSSFKGMSKNMKIICPIHGEFGQTPKSHTFQGRYKNTKDDFVNLAKEKFGDRYDYSLVDYKTTEKPVKIICPIHGEFEQTPYHHLISKTGCPFCGGTARQNTEFFINRAKKVHNNKFNYSKVDYKNKDSKINIICPIHGEFEQQAGSHLRGNGCSKCSGKAQGTTQSFIENSTKVHGDKYDYSNLNYVNAYTPVEIICRKHGSFVQKANNHLNGAGCPRCSESKGENLINEILSSYDISFIRQHKFSDCTNNVKGRLFRKLPFDFFMPIYNTAIEFDGQQHFIPVFGEDEFRRLQKTDNLKNQYCEAKGIKLIRIPYTMKKEDIEPYILSELGM